MKDYSNYFKKPSLNEAKRRSRNEIGRYDDVYHVPADMIKAGVGKKYYIQTYGCQANERDSETLSGILESMSYRATDEIKEADIIICLLYTSKENLQVLPMYQDIVSTALRTEKPTQVKKHRTLSCVV